MDHVRRAKNNYLMGYSCAQAVVLAFSDVTGLDDRTALRMASSFGGGMGKLRETCGALTGMMIVAGLIYGYDDPMDFIDKSEHFARVRRLASKFKQENGSMICRELRGVDENDRPLPAVASTLGFESRPCAELCASAARILDNYIENNGANNRLFSKNS